MENENVNLENLPTVINTNGRDYASCPNCRHYNAMMPYPEGYAKCRDCGYLAIVKAPEAILEESEEDTIMVISCSPKLNELIEQENKERFCQCCKRVLSEIVRSSGHGGYLTQVKNFPDFAEYCNECSPKFDFFMCVECNFLFTRHTGEHNHERQGYFCAGCIGKYKLTKETFDNWFPVDLFGEFSDYDEEYHRPIAFFAPIDKAAMYYALYDYMLKNTETCETRDAAIEIYKTVEGELLGVYTGEEKHGLLLNRDKQKIEQFATVLASEWNLAINTAEFYLKCAALVDSYREEKAGMREDGLCAGFGITPEQYFDDQNYLEDKAGAVAEVMRWFETACPLTYALVQEEILRKKKESERLDNFRAIGEFFEAGQHYECFERFDALGWSEKAECLEYIMEITDSPFKAAEIALQWFHNQEGGYEN